MLFTHKKTLPPTKRTERDRGQHLEIRRIWRGKKTHIKRVNNPYNKHFFLPHSVDLASYVYIFEK